MASEDARRELFRKDSEAILLPPRTPAVLSAPPRLNLWQKFLRSGQPTPTRNQIEDGEISEIRKLRWYRDPAALPALLKVSRFSNRHSEAVEWAARETLVDLFPIWGAVDRNRVIEFFERDRENAVEFFRLPDSSAGTIGGEFLADFDRLILNARRVAAGLPDAPDLKGRPDMTVVHYSEAAGTVLHAPLDILDATAGVALREGPWESVRRIPGGLALMVRAAAQDVGPAVAGLFTAGFHGLRGTRLGGAVVNIAGTLLGAKGVVRGIRSGVSAIRMGAPAGTAAAPVLVRLGSVFGRLNLKNWEKSEGMGETSWVTRFENDLGRGTVLLFPGKKGRAPRLRVELSAANMDFPTPEVLAELRNFVRRARAAEGGEFNVKVCVSRPALRDTRLHGIPDLILWDMDATGPALRFLNDLADGPRLREPARRAWAESGQIRGFYDGIRPENTNPGLHPLFDGSRSPKAYTPTIRAEPVPPPRPFPPARRTAPVIPETPIVVTAALKNLVREIPSVDPFKLDLARWSLEWKRETAAGRRPRWVARGETPLGNAQISIRSGAQPRVRVEIARRTESPLLFEREMLAELEETARFIREEFRAENFRVRARIMRSSGDPAAAHPQGAVAFELAPGDATVRFLDELFKPGARIRTRRWREFFGEPFQGWIDQQPFGDWSEPLTLPEPGR